jgi:hypothetical protein
MEYFVTLADLVIMPGAVVALSRKQINAVSGNVRLLDASEVDDGLRADLGVRWPVEFLSPGPLPTSSMFGAVSTLVVGENAIAATDVPKMERHLSRTAAGEHEEVVAWDDLPVEPIPSPVEIEVERAREAAALMDNPNLNAIVGSWASEDLRRQILE